MLQSAFVYVGCLCDQVLKLKICGLYDKPFSCFQCVNFGVDSPTSATFEYVIWSRFFIIQHILQNCLNSFTLWSSFPFPFFFWQAYVIPKISDLLFFFSFQDIMLKSCHLVNLANLQYWRWGLRFSWVIKTWCLVHHMLVMKMTDNQLDNKVTIQYSV